MSMLRPFLRRRTPLMWAVAALAAIVLLGIFIKPAESQVTSVDLTGWAWGGEPDGAATGGVGWISLNCINGDPSGGSICATSNYKLTLNADNTVTGYAWSDNIGWIKFGGLSGFPAGSGTTAANANLSGSTITGWARACAGTAPGDCSTMTDRSDGWDGWIALSGTGWTVTTAANSSYSPATSGAWGGDVVGWLAFNLTNSFTPATCTMNASPSTYYALSAPASLQLNYITTGASTASIDQGQGSVTVGSGSKTVSPVPTTVGTTRYTMTVTNTGGSPNTCFTDVTVTGGFAPPSGCISVGANNPTCAAPVVKSGSVAKNKAPGATLYWTVNNASTCTLATSTSMSVTNPNTTGFLTGPLANRTEYTLSCSGGGGAFSDKAVINILPEFKEI